METNNLTTYSNSDTFENLLRSFDIIQQGHFEYKKVHEDGSHAHGDYFINYRKLTTGQELELAPHYVAAIGEWFSGKEIIIAGVAMGSLSLPKVIQLQLFKESGVEYLYTEKREGILGIFGEQAEKCKGKHVLFIEDVCNNATSSRQLIDKMEQQKETLGITGYSMLYGVHRGNAYLEKPEGEFYAMSHFKASSYHKSECPVCLSGEAVPLKEYKK
jgi:orotate phosphoribosyltransferase